MNRLRPYLVIVTCCCICFITKTANSQLIEQNEIPTNKLAVPFLLLSSDAISSGMGDAGAALVTKAGAVESNTAKASFLKESLGINLTYTPWLRKLVNDRKLMFIGGFFKLNPNTTLTASLNYLSYGRTDLIDDNQVSLGTMQPTEYVGSIGLSKSFGSSFGLGMKLKLVRSNLYSGTGSAVWLQSGTAFCVDLSSYHSFPVNAFSNNSEIAVSVNLENIGPKISYFNQSDQKSYLPTNLKIGTAFKTTTNADDEIGIALDFNKLLVPFRQLKPDQSVMESMIASFDTNNGFGINNISVSLGAEYTYKKNISFRLGYNFQGDERLPGRFFSMGMGVKHKRIDLNLAYLTGNPQRTFLSNTIRITLGYSLP